MRGAESFTAFLRAVARGERAPEVTYGAPVGSRQKWVNIAGREPGDGCGDTPCLLRWSWDNGRSPDAVLTTPCDVLSPCATGGVLSDATIRGLACHAVVGAANNQLATPEDAARLAARDILYAPDYVANAGGVIWLAGYETLGWDNAQMRARLAGIEQTLEEIFTSAADTGVTTAEAADLIALDRIAAAGRN